MKGECLNTGHIDILLKFLEKIDVVAIGPGLGLEDETKNAVIEFLSRTSKPAVIDADALKALSGKINIVSGKEVVLTPHAGEFRIVTGISVGDDWRQRMKYVEDIARKYNITILLKGHYDIISNGKNTKVNRTGTPAMTVGGTGDVLTGITATLLAQSNNPFRSACAAAFVNGLAGMLAEEKMGPHIVATDVIDNIPQAFKSID